METEPNPVVVVSEPGGIAAEIPPERPPRTSPSVGARMISVAEKAGVPAVLVLLLIVFTILKPHTFLTERNLSGIAATEDVALLLALGGMVPLIAGEFDLSIGYTLGFTSMLVAVLTVNDGMNVWVASVIAVAVGIAIGVCNAILVLKIGINTFIATLASGTVLSGLTLLISHSTVIAGSFSNSFLKLGVGGPGGVPIGAFCVLGFAIVLLYWLEHTPVGRRLEAVGQGRDAARLAGVRVNRLVLVSLVVSAFVAGLAGVLNTAAQGSADPSVGADLLLPALAAGFLGATTIRPGRFNVIGTVLSVALLAVGVNGLAQLGAPQWVSPVFDGGVLLTAVGAARFRSRRA